MKIVGVRTAQQHLSGLVADSQRQRVILTRHGRPVAVLTGVEGQDLEDVILASDAKFRAFIRERRKDKGPYLSHEEVAAEAREALALEKARRRRRSRRPAKR
jgi:prevent-host-death family protein